MFAAGAVNCWVSYPLEPLTSWGPAVNVLAALVNAKEPLSIPPIVPVTVKLPVISKLPVQSVVVELTVKPLEFKVTGDEVEPILIPSVATNLPFVELPILIPCDWISILVLVL